MRTLAGVLCVALSLALVGCAGEEEGGDTVVSGARTPPSLPSLGTVRWQTDGGSAIGQANFDGGLAGGIQVVAQFGAVARHSGQSLPTPTKNLLASMGSAITYTDLTALLTPSIGGTTATFTLPVDTGFHLPGGATLNLSDAVGGVIDEVVIESTQPIRIDGTILTARTASDSVDLVLNHSGSTELGLVVTGTINTSGASMRSGGNTVLVSFTSIVLTGTLDARGGAANAAMTTNAGQGGNLNIVTSFGDVLLSSGAFSARGGSAEGTGTAGGGGSFSLSSLGTTDRDLHVQALTSGGNAVADTAGPGGTVSITWFGARSAFLYADTSGGSTTGAGAGNNAGVISVSASDTTFSGAAVLLANGGSSAVGAGAQGASTSITALAYDLARIQAQVNGGAGDTGGNASAFNMAISASPGTQLLDVVLDVEVNGGDGATSGGAGGVINCFNGSAPAGRFVNIQTSATGGDGQTAGNGASMGSSTFRFSTLRDAVIESDTSGGNGDNAGNGGGVTLDVYTGSKIRHEVVANGGNGISGGDAGASILLWSLLNGLTHTVTANGGTGTIMDGGLGGSVTFSASVSSPLLAGTLDYTLLGGTSSTGQGGSGGGAFLSMNGGSFIGSLELVANGGNATAGTADGGAGGSSFFDFGTWEGSLDVEVSGGSSVAGTGGSAASLSFNVNAPFSGTSRFTGFEVAATGGDSETGNGGPGAGLNWSSITDLELAGSVDISGGNGATVSGNANGGQGGVCTFGTGPARLNLNLNVDARGGDGRGNSGGGTGGGFSANGSEVRLRGTYNTSGGSVLGSGTGDAGFAGGMLIGALFNVNLGGTFSAIGGSAPAGDAGGGGGTFNVNSSAGGITSSATINVSGGTGNTGFGGATGQVFVNCPQGPLVVSGSINAIGGDSNSGVGGVCQGLTVSGCVSINWSGNYTGRSGNSATGNGGGAGSVSINIDTGGGSISGDFQLNAGNAGTSGTGGSTGGFGMNTNGPLTISGQFTANAGTSASGDGGNSTGFFLSGNGDLTLSSLIRLHGGASTTGNGGTAGNINLSNNGDITISGTVEAFAGSGATGADGPNFNFGNDSAATLTLTSSARIRANGGAPAGMPGLIILDPTGTGGLANTNLVEQTGRVLQTLTGAGTDTGNITRD